MKSNAAKELDDALAWMDAEISAAQIRPGEFTIDMAVERAARIDPAVTHDKIRHMLERKVKRGELVARKILLGARRINAYSVKRGG